MKHLYVKTVLGFCMLFFVSQFLMAQSLSSKVRKGVLATRAKIAATTTTKQTTQSLATTANKTSNVKPKLLALTTQSKQVTLLDREENDYKKIYYKWNEYGHLLSKLAYFNSINDEWTLDSESSDSRIYEYDYSNGKCVRKSTYSVNSEGKKNIELERIVASTDAEGIYREKTYEYDSDSNEVLISQEIGYDKFGNLTTDISYYHYDGTTYKNGFDRRFTKATDIKDSYFDDDSGICTMNLHYSGNEVYGTKIDIAETANSWTYKRYEKEPSDNDFSLVKNIEYVWNAEHDRIIRIRTNDIEKNITYDALKRPIKMVITSGDKTYTNTYTYASNTVVYDHTNPVYTTYYNDYQIMTPNDILVEINSLEAAYMSTYGPVSQFVHYDLDYDTYMIKGTATFDAEFRCKQVSAEQYYSESGNSFELDEKAKIDYYHKSDGRLDYYISTEIEEQGNTEIDKVVINYSADGRREGCTYYEWENESWNLTSIEYRSRDDKGRIILQGEKYITEEGEWNGSLYKYTYDSSDNCSSTRYICNNQTGEWEIYNNIPYLSQYEENGFLVTIYSDYEKQLEWISPSKKPIMNSDFFSLYDAFPFSDGLYELSVSNLFFSYTRDDISSDFTLRYVHGNKDYWKDSNTYVVETYYSKDTNLEPSSTTTYTVDSHNRVVGINNEWGTFAYTYLNDTNLLLSASNGTNTTKYYYSSHEKLDGVNALNAADTKLFTCTGRHIESQQPMNIYNVAGQCIASGITETSLSAPGLYIVKVGTETSKIYVK